MTSELLAAVIGGVVGAVVGSIGGGVAVYFATSATNRAEQKRRKREELHRYYWSLPGASGWLIPAELVNGRGTTKILEQDEVSEAEIQVILVQNEARLRGKGMVGEQLEEVMRKEEEFLRRPWIS
jgi:hypothetical protein